MSLSTRLTREKRVAETEEVFASLVKAEKAARNEKTERLRLARLALEEQKRVEE